MSKTQWNFPYSSDVCLYLRDAKNLENNPKCIIIITIYKQFSTVMKEASFNVFVYRMNNTIVALKIICSFLSSSNETSS